MPRECRNFIGVTCSIFRSIESRVDSDDERTCLLTFQYLDALGKVGVVVRVVGAVKFPFRFVAHAEFVAHVRHVPHLPAYDVVHVVRFRPRRIGVPLIFRRILG